MFMDVRMCECIVYMKGKPSSSSLAISSPARAAAAWATCLTACSSAGGPTLSTATRARTSSWRWASWSSWNPNRIAAAGNGSGLLHRRPCRRTPLRRRAAATEAARTGTKTASMAATAPAATRPSPATPATHAEPAALVAPPASRRLGCELKDSPIPS